MSFIGIGECKNNINDEILKIFLFNNIKAKRYLDMGCGNGNLTVKIGKIIDAEEIYGVDIDNEVLANFSSIIKGVQYDFETLPRFKLPFENDYFDLITAIEFIEHLSYGDDLLQEVHRLLSEKGFFLLTTPNLASLLNRSLLLFGFQPTYSSPSKYYNIGGRKLSKKVPISDYGHKNLYTLKALKHIFDLNNFKIIKIIGCQAEYDRFSFIPVEKIPSLAPNILILSQKKN